MMFQIKVAFQKQERLLRYNTKFHTGQMFLEEVMMAFDRTDIHLLQDDLVPIHQDRLERMLEAVANGEDALHDAFEGFKLEEETLCLKVSTSAIGARKRGEIMEPMKSEKKKNVKSMSTLAKELCPRVCTKQMARETGLPLGAFITTSASVYLTETQKEFWEEKQYMIKDGSGDPENLSKYYSQSNKQIIEANKLGQNWMEGKTGHFYISYNKWCEKYLDDFLQNYIESEEEEEDEQEVQLQLPPPIPSSSQPQRKGKKLELSPPISSSQQPSSSQPQRKGKIGHVSKKIRDKK
eukprot:TRINITY_DN10066_c0_g1_i1.p1 TRINITY_DN10066_c0_g1~~TRINITY_DN10066_c0_g1_i1.p1  ORF type:complete len:294 (-),score=37.49 TRINITY_DN10066_c0_g1_i1:143-1024(-)